MVCEPYNWGNLVFGVVVLLGTTGMLALIAYNAGRLRQLKDDLRDRR